MYVHWGDSNEYTQHIIFVHDRKDIPKLFPFVFGPGAIINPKCLELSIWNKFACNWSATVLRKRDRLE